MNRSTPFPLGATLDDEGCNFAIYTPTNKDILLALFHADGSYETHQLEQEYAGIKYTYIPNVHSGQKYGYLIQLNDELHYIADPYARALDSSLHYDPPFDSHKSFDLPKCIVTSVQFDWQSVPKPRIARDEMVLFETHVKGLTQLNPEVDTPLRGKYLGLVSQPMLDFYRQQNINTLQLLPIAACMHEPHLLESDKVNYWGYNPYLFMAPDPRYANTDAVNELKTTIRELHRHGIQVILDVVYNHTAEGGANGPVFNLKALDPNYYLHHGEHYANYTGCGNTVDLSNQAALNLVMDTLRSWVIEYHIDGFRFDLAATLAAVAMNSAKKQPFSKPLHKIRYCARSN